MDSLKITYKIFLEAEGVSWHRILTSTDSISNAMKNHPSPYINCAVWDNESDMDEEVFRFFVDETIEEEACTSDEDAEFFLDDMADLMAAIAHMHSYLDIEGELSIAYKDINRKFTFHSEPGDPTCGFNEI